MQVLRTAASAFAAANASLAASANNVANASTVRPAGEAPYRAQRVVLEPAAGGGVAVAGVAEGNPDGIPAYAPSHPYADAEGLVRLPDVDLADEAVGQQLSVLHLRAARAAFEAADEALSSLIDADL